MLVGYIISGDPTYITSYNAARSMICRLERDEIIEELKSGKFAAIVDSTDLNAGGLVFVPVHYAGNLKTVEVPIPVRYDTKLETLYRRQVYKVEASDLKASHPFAENTDNTEVCANELTAVVAVREVKPETVDIAARPGKHEVTRRVEAELAPGGVCRRDRRGEDQECCDDELFHLVCPFVFLNYIKIRARRTSWREILRTSCASAP